MRLRLPVPAALLTNRARRAGAALCLALALLTWLSPSSHTSPARIVVPPGMVAASTAVYADAVAFVHDGDRIDLIEPTGGMTGGASGPSATSSAPITPVVPRRVSGGSSLKRNFVTGQLKPQPTEVTARNIRPAGAIRPGVVGFDSVMEPGKG